VLELAEAIKKEYISFLIHLFTCAYIVWAISPRYSSPSPNPPQPSLPGRNCSALISDFVEEKNISNNKKDKAFLLIEIRIAVQRDS
jgi:hypothetical protein